MLKFLRPDGEKCRPEFADVDEMNEFIIQEHNKIVRPQDKFYCLGDVAMAKKNIPLAGRLNGHGRLVRGNHDIEKTSLYLKYFEEVYATRVFDDFILSHIPLHPESIKPQWTNVHGHVHNNVKFLHFGPKYLNISCEVTRYRPLSLEELKQRIKDQVEYRQEFLDSTSVQQSPMDFDKWVFHGRNSWVDWVSRK